MRRAAHRATVVVAAVALAGLAASCGGGAPRGRPGSEPSSTAPTSATPTIGTAGPYSWARDTAPAAAIGGGATATLGAVLPPQAPRGWLAIGSRTAADGTTTAVVWSSSDALHWTATPLTGSGVDSQARAATTWGSRTVVVGSVGRGPDERAAVWLAPRPGAPFVAVPDATVFTAGGSTARPASGGATMDVVAAGALGLFASGSVAGHLALWYSTNGQHWIRLDDAEKLITSSPGARVNALLVTGDGVRAAGSVRDGNVDDAALWASSDGIHWQRVDADEEAFKGAGDHVITGLAELGTGYAAVGGTRSGDRWAPASWISPDGNSWSEPSGAFPLGGPAPAAEGGTLVRAVTAIPVGPATTRLVAVGGSDERQRVWTSSDGLSWSEVALPAGAAGSTAWRATLVAADRRQLVVADGDPGQPHLLSEGPNGWEEPSASPAEFGPVQPTARPGALVSTADGLLLAVDVTEPPQQLGSARATVVVLRSADGVTWTKVASGGPFDDGTVDGLLAERGHLVAVGTRSSPSSADTPVPAAWSSTDGRSWTALSPSAGGEGILPARVAGIAQLGGTDVAVGYGSPAAPPTATGQVALAWTSGGSTWTPAAALDPDPGLGPEQALGACAAGHRVAAVGSVTTASQGPGRRAAAWWSTDGRHWTPASTTPAAAEDTDETLLGCVGGPQGLVAYGTTTDADGIAEPALWRSPDGRRWTRQSVTAFQTTSSAPAAPAPLDDLARAGSTWMATSGSGTPETDTLPGAQLGLWWSTDGGRHWRRLDTSNPVWQGDARGELAEVAFVGDNPVVAGDVDGQLAVWVGTPGS